MTNGEMANQIEKDLQAGRLRYHACYPSGTTPPADEPEIIRGIVQRMIADLRKNPDAEYTSDPRAVKLIEEAFTPGPLPPGLVA